MSTAAAAPEPPPGPRRALADFAAAGFRPRETMRRVLDGGRDRMIAPLVLLLTISVLFGDVDRRPLSGFGQFAPWQIALIACAALLLSFLFALLLLYLFSWAALGIGRALEGEGSARELRSAMAWGGVPFIWALLYRIPAVIWFPATRTKVGGEHVRFSFNALQAGHGCLTMLVFGILELATLGWYLYVVSNTIGEAHRFSSWRGLATLLLTAVTPIVIVIAAVLAM
jgi:hypothetical protein